MEKPKPIATISLPTHLPAIANTKEGDYITITACRVKAMPPPKPIMDGDEMPPRPVPLTTDFHVESVESKAKASPEAPPRPAPKKKSNPLDFVKNKRVKSMVSEMADTY